MRAVLDAKPLAEEAGGGSLAPCQSACCACWRQLTAAHREQTVNHGSLRVTKRCDRTNDAMSLDEIGRMLIRAAVSDCQVKNERRRESKYD